MSKIIQIASHGLSLVALCEDGSLFRQFVDGSGWVRIEIPGAMQPDAKKDNGSGVTVEQILADIDDESHVAGPIKPPCNGEIPSQYTPSEWPEGAEWWAVDVGQTAWFYSDEPSLEGNNWFGSRSKLYDGGYDKHYKEGTITDYSTSLRRKPEPELSGAADAVRDSLPHDEDWIEWSGGEMPVKDGEIVDVRWRGGNTHLGITAGRGDANQAHWKNDGMIVDIIAYRIRNPKQEPETEGGSHD